MNHNKLHISQVILSCLICLTFFDIASAKLSEKNQALNNPDNYISVEFNNAPLAEIVILVSEFTEQSFVISSDQEVFLSWVEPNIYKDDLILSFRKVIVSAGLSLNIISGKKNLFVIKNVSSVVPNSENSLGFFNLKNIDSKSLEDTSKVLYGDSLAINTLEDSNIVLFSGSPELVTDFIDLLNKIDKPKQNDIDVIRLKNISVKAGIKALADTKLISDNNFYADYWNRSILIKGTIYERNVAIATLTAIDKPQTGWIDQLEYIYTVDSEAVTALLNSTAKDVEVRIVAKNRILISGFEQDVEKASNLLHKVDGSGLQVKVEAIIAYLTDREFKELGLKLSYSNNSFTGSINKNLINTLITQNTGLLLDYFNDVLGITVAAEEGKAHGEILSSPVLTVLNGKEARIHVGQNIPYLSKANFNQNDGRETGTSIERKDVGITFTIQPTIEPNGEFVYLDVSQVVSNITDDSELSQSAVDIIVDKKEIKSTIMVADGDTIFLGGLRSEENGTAKDFIPLLGEIPFLGKLFTYDVEQKATRHLIVSLRVNVIGKDNS